MTLAGDPLYTDHWGSVKGLGVIDAEQGQTRCGAMTLAGGGSSCLTTIIAPKC